MTYNLPWHSFFVNEKPPSLAATSGALCDLRQLRGAVERCSLSRSILFLSPPNGITLHFLSTGLGLWPDKMMALAIIRGRKLPRGMGIEITRMILKRH